MTEKNIPSSELESGSHDNQGHNPEHQQHAMGDDPTKRDATGSSPEAKPALEIHSLEEYDALFTEFSQKLDTIVDAVQKLSPEDRGNYFHITKDAEYPQGKTHYEKEARLCDRLIEAYASGDPQGFENIPPSGGDISEDQIRDLLRMSFPNMSNEEIDKKTAAASAKKLRYSNSITGGFLGGIAGKTDPAFGNETVGTRIQGLHSSHSVMTVLLRADRQDLAEDIDALVSFLVKKEEETQRAIVASPEFLEAQNNQANQENRRERRENLRRSYLGLEIQKKDEVLPIAERIRDLYRLAHNFVLKVSSGIAEEKA